MSVKLGTVPDICHALFTLSVLSYLAPFLFLRVMVCCVVQVQKSISNPFDYGDNKCL